MKKQSGGFLAFPAAFLTAFHPGLIQQGPSIRNAPCLNGFSATIELGAFISIFLQIAFFPFVLAGTEAARAAESMPANSASVGSLSDDEIKTMLQDYIDRDKLGAGL